MNTKSITRQNVSVIYKSIVINETEIFYREAGAKEKPKLLLLHGYPASSHMFRNVIPVLAQQFHVLAPDLPGFGFSAVPSIENFEYTFENFAKILAQFLLELKIEKTSFYLFDYGAPIIMHLICSNPSCVDVLIFQNGNIYNEGLGEGIKKAMDLFANPNNENWAKLKKLVEPEYIEWEYLTGVSDLTKIAPEAYTLDQQLMEREGLKEIHLAIKKDYGNNLAYYAIWQETIKKMQYPILIVWGENDQVFIKDGAKVLHDDNANSRLFFYPTGHFALEEFGNEIVEEIISYYEFIYPS